MDQTDYNQAATASYKHEAQFYVRAKNDQLKFVWATLLCVYVACLCFNSFCDE